MAAEAAARETGFLVPLVAEILRPLRGCGPAFATLGGGVRKSVKSVVGNASLFAAIVVGLLFLPKT